MAQTYYYSIGRDLLSVHIYIYIYICTSIRLNESHMWQSWVAIKHYSVVHFNHVTVFEALLHRTSVKGGADTHYRLTRYLYTYAAQFSSALDTSSTLQCFKHGNAVKICNGIMLHFYLGLPHLHVFCTLRAN